MKTLKIQRTGLLVMMTAVFSLVLVGCSTPIYTDTDNEGTVQPTADNQLDTGDDGDMVGDNMNDDAMIGDDATGRIFASSNTASMLGVYTLTTDQGIMEMMIDIENEDADGLYFDGMTLYQIDRTNNRIVSYDNVNEMLMQQQNLIVDTRSTSDFTNGRGLTMNNDTLVVAQDANDENGDQNALVVYQVDDDEILYETMYMTDINLWGVWSDGNDLHAIVDNSNKLAIFEDFYDLEDVDMLMPTTTVTIEGLTRTHGLAYDASSDMMVLTDIGSADADDDGAIVLVADFGNAIEDGTIMMDEQILIEGPSTMLGNPVDIAYSPEDEMIYIAERAMNGGMILGFDMMDESGDATPVVANEFPGASAVWFTTEVN